MSAAEDREVAIALLEALTALLKEDAGIPLPSVRVDIWARSTGDNAATAIRAMNALPGPWTAQQKDYQRAYLQMSTKAASVEVDIMVPAEDAGVETGTRVVTEWEPKPEFAALLSEPMRDES